MPALPVLKTASGKSLKSLPKPTASSLTGRKVAVNSSTRGPIENGVGVGGGPVGDERAADGRRRAADAPGRASPAGGQRGALELLADRRAASCDLAVGAVERSRPRRCRCRVPRGELGGARVHQRAGRRREARRAGAGRRACAALPAASVEVTRKR